MSDIMHLYNVMLCWINLSQSQSQSQSVSIVSWSRVTLFFFNGLSTRRGYIYGPYEFKTTFNPSTNPTITTYTIVISNTLTNDDTKITSWQTTTGPEPGHYYQHRWGSDLSMTIWAISTRKRNIFVVIWWSQCLSCCYHHIFCQMATDQS